MATFKRPTAPIGPPPPPMAAPTGPTAPDNDPVIAALSQVLTAAAGTPNHAAQLTGFAGAENQIKTAYAAALPKIAAAYQQVRKDLEGVHQQAMAEHGRTGQARGQQVAQGRAAIGDDSALRSAMAMVGGAQTGEASLDSIMGTGAAQTQGQLASYDAARGNENAYATAMANVENASHAQRLDTTGAIKGAGDQLASTYQDKGLAAVAKAAAAQAERQAAQSQRSSGGGGRGRSGGGSRGGGRGGRSGGGEEAAPAGLSGRAFIDSKKGDFPVATEYLNQLFGGAGSLQDVLGELKSKAGKDGNIKYKGKRLNARVLAEWASEADRLGG